MYKQILDSTSVRRLSDGASIPADPRNSDYAAYMRWLSEGNTPEPAETDAEKTARLMAVAKTHRNSLLAESDPWALPDFPGGGTQAVLDYRQALRDWPASNTTLAQLENPVWPTKPI